MKKNDRKVTAENVSVFGEELRSLTRHGGIQARYSHLFFAHSRRYLQLGHESGSRKGLEGASNSGRKVANDQ